MLRSLVASLALLGSLIISPAAAQQPARSECLAMSDAAPRATPVALRQAAAAADEVATKEPAQAIELDHKSLAKLQKLGVKVVTDVDRAGFIKIAEPLQETLAKRRGPHAEKILQICRSIE